MYKYQFGLRKKSYISFSDEVMDSIYQCWDNHESTMGIFLDSQKAFDIP